MKTCRKGLHQYEGKQCLECAEINRLLHKEEISLKKKAYDKEHRAEQSEKRRQRRKADPTKYKELDKAIRAKSRHKRTAAQIKREANKIQRTPRWLTQLHFDQIELFYESARELTKEFGFQIDVDHIIPLRGVNVSGLHVPWNLQLLSHDENMSKGNKHG